MEAPVILSYRKTTKGPRLADCMQGIASYPVKNHIDFVSPANLLHLSAPAFSKQVHVNKEGVKVFDRVHFLQTCRNH